MRDIQMVTPLDCKSDLKEMRMQLAVLHFFFTQAGKRDRFSAMPHLTKRISNLLGEHGSLLLRKPFRLANSVEELTTFHELHHQQQPGSVGTKLFLDGRNVQLCCQSKVVPVDLQETCLAELTLGTVHQGTGLRWRTHRTRSRCVGDCCT